MTAETCPHYLHYANDEIASADPRFKCAPAIGDDRDRSALWRALADGTLDTVGSDHSPCPPELKFLAERDFLHAWGGIASLQLTLSIMWTGALARRVPLDRLSEWLSTAPARLIGMAHRKGKIVGGFDADLVIWNPDERWTVDASKLEHRHKLTPYDGEQLFGRVVRTYVRGQVVFDDGRFCARPFGQLLQRGKQTR